MGCNCGVRCDRQSGSCSVVGGCDWVMAVCVCLLKKIIIIIK